MRLNSYTQTMPKCMLNIHNQTILERQVKFLKKYSVSKIILVIGYQSQMIKDHAKGIDEQIIELVINEDYATTNNMYSLYLTKHLVKGQEFVLLNGDCVFEEKVIEKIMSCHDSAAPYDSANFDLEELKLKIKDDKAYQIMPKKIDEKDSDGSTIGIFKFSKEASNLIFSDMDQVIQSGKRNEWFEYSLSNIFNQTVFKPINVCGLKWAEIDDENDYEKALRVF